MRLHIWGINYSPEVTGIAPYNVALCENLVEAGHSVRMITSFCYYPAWKKLPTEQFLLARTDEMDGVTVHRCWHYVPKRVTTLRRIVHELSFVATTFLRQLILPRPDLIVVVSPPLLLGFAAWLLTKLKRTRFVFHVQDLQPDAAANLGMVRVGGLLRVLRWLERFAYRKAEFVSGITPGMVQSFRDKGVPSQKAIYFPNGIAIPEFRHRPARGAWRKLHGFGNDDFLVVYSGNIGRKQGLEALLAVAAEVRSPAIRILVCGDGAELDRLKAAATQRNLRNVSFHPLQPEPRYRELLVDANVCVIPQKPGSGHCFFPSKLLPTLAFGCPVLALTEEETELARAVREGGFGAVFGPDRPTEIAAYLDGVSNDRKVLREMGQAGLKFVRRFDQTTVLSEFRAQLESLPNQKKMRLGEGQPQWNRGRNKLPA